MNRRKSYPEKPVTFISCAPPPGGWYQVCESTIRGLKEEGLVTVDLRLEEKRGLMSLLEELATIRKGDPYVLVAISPTVTIQILKTASRYSYSHVTPIGALGTDYGVLVVPEGSPVADLNGLLRAMKRDPDGAIIGGGQPGGVMHHGIVTTVASAAGLGSSRVRYVESKSIQEALYSLRESRTSAAALGLSNIVGELGKGTLRVLAVLSDRRLQAPLHNLPTAVEQGLNVTFPMWRGFLGAAGLDAEVTQFWTDTLTRLANSKTWSLILESLGWFPFLRTGQEFARFLEEDAKRYAAIVGSA